MYAKQKQLIGKYIICAVVCLKTQNGDLQYISCLAAAVQLHITVSWLTIDTQACYLLNK